MSGDTKTNVQQVKKCNEEDPVNAEDYDFLRFIVSDFHGIARCKVVTKSAYPHMKNKGPGMAWKTVLLSFDNYFNCDAKREDGKKCTDARLTPAEDVTIPRHLPWAGCGKYNVGAVMCETWWGIDNIRQEACPRYIARRLCDQLEKEHNLKLLHAVEMEFIMLNEDNKPLFDSGSLYIPQEFALLEHELLALSDNLEKAGIPIETLQTEFGAGQIEIVMKPVFGIEGADNEFILKNAVKEMLQKPGQHSRSTFVSRPIEDKVGSANHWNHSLWWTNGKDAMWDEKSESGLSEVAQHWLAGILKHAPALSSMQCPTVNCWRRLHVQGGTRDIGTPSAITWGVENRLTMIRVIARGGGKCTYFENRLGGSAMNPYLALAAHVAAGLDGIKNKLPLPPQGTEENFCGTLPMSLEDSLVALENDKELTEYMSPEFVKWYVDAKRKEQEVLDIHSKRIGDKFKAEMEFYSKWL